MELLCLRTIERRLVLDRSASEATSGQSGLSCGFRFLRFLLLRWVIVVSLVLNTLGYSNQVRAFDPVTVGMALSVGQTVLSMTAKKNDVSGVVLQQTYRLVQELHNRMHAMETSLTVMLKRLNELPELMREEVERGGRLQRLRSVLGQVGAVKTKLEEVQRDPNVRDLAKWAAFEVKVSDLEAERVSLMAESDLVVPVLVVAMAMEIQIHRFRDARPLPRDVTYMAGLPKVLAAYDRRFSDALDETKQDSLSWLRAKLEAEQLEAEKSIAKALGLTDVVTPGLVEWFKIVVHKTQPKLSKRCGVGISPSGDGLGMVECYDVPDGVEPIGHHTHAWSREVSVTLIPGHEAAGLKTINVTASGPQITPGDFPNVPHGTDAVALQTPFMNELKEGGGFHAQLDVFNERAKAIADLRNLEQMASVALTVTANVDDRVVKTLGAEAASYGGDEIDIQAHERYLRYYETQRTIAEIEGARKDAKATQESAEKAIKEETDKARRERWRSDLLMAIQVSKGLVQGYQLWTRVAEEFGEADPVPDAGNPIEEAHSAGGVAIDPRQATQSSKEGSASEPTDELSLVDRRHSANLKDRIRIEEIIREVKKRPFDPSRQPSEQLTREETLILEGMARANRWSATAADTFYETYRIDPVEEGTALLKDGLTGTGADRATSAALLAIRPEVLADGTLDSIRHRNSLMKELQELYKPYFNHRFGEILKGGTGPGAVQVDDCWDQKCWELKKP